MASLHERRENLLFAIDHLTDAIHHAREAGEDNTADTLGDMVMELAGVVMQITEQQAAQDAVEVRALIREMEAAQ